MPLTYQDVINEGILDALATAYRDPTNARVLLTSVGFPRARIPSGGNPMDFWSTVCEQIDDGVFRGGFDALVEAAARNYPGNSTFARFFPPDGNGPSQNNAVSVVVTGWGDVQHLIDTARRLAEGQGMPPESVNLAFSNVEGVLLNLTNWTPDQALTFANELEAAADPSPEPVRTSVATSEFIDYLISRLFIEGPDQARFEINDVRASTPVRDVARGVIAEYNPKMFGGEGAEQGRHVVVDHVKDDGSAERLDPDKTLHDHGIQDGDTLSVSPESRAGAVNPTIREDALARARGQVVAYAQSHPGFGVSANSRHTPTEYLFRFETPSFAPPPAPGADPIEIKEHEVLLALPPGFPMEAPAAFWQTDIFHPNVHPQVGKVCLGDLEDRYRPGMDFGDLCQLLVDIASYRNYALIGVLNGDALKWALSEQGQKAIAGIGGEPVLERFLSELREKKSMLPPHIRERLDQLPDELPPPRPLCIKRV